MAKLESESKDTSNYSVQFEYDPKTMKLKDKAAVATSNNGDKKDKK